MSRKRKLFRTLGEISLEIYHQLGGLHFDEKDFQLAFGYELSKKKIEYLRETHIELYYKEIPIKLGAPDFYLHKTKPPTIIELKLGASIQNINRQQLKMYLVSIRRDPQSVLSKVDRGFLINFLKEDPTTYEDEVKSRKKTLYKIEIEYFLLTKEEELKRLEQQSLGEIN